MVVTIILFVVLLGILVLVHEWGHFIVARKLGVRVEEFAFGFPPRVASIMRGGTRYAVNLLPIGGYVKIFGESGDDDFNPESFSSRPVWQRTAIIAAGVAMNVVLAWVLFSAGHAVGLPTVVGEDENGRVTIIAVAPGSPAERGGLHFGDVILALGTAGTAAEIRSADQVQNIVTAHRGEPIIIDFLRGSERTRAVVTPRERPPQGEGALGIAMARIAIIKSPIWRAPWDGLKTTASAVLATAGAIRNIAADFVARGTVPRDVSGPVGIFVFANQTRRLGSAYLFELAAIISINLALFNILPVPGLDGGRMLFLAIERLRGARISRRVEEISHAVGLALLLLAMAAITYRDVARFF